MTDRTWSRVGLLLALVAASALAIPALQGSGRESGVSDPSPRERPGVASRTAPGAQGAGEAGAGAAGDRTPAQVARPAGSQRRPERPSVLRLPSGTTMGVDVATTGPRGKLRIPDGVHNAGWWGGSSRLGDPFGAIVLAAHVDSLTEGIGPIAELLSSRRGDPIGLSGRRLNRRFEVTSVSFVRRTSLSPESPYFSARGDLRLVLITCAGPYDESYGGYRDNVIVIAKPAR